VNIDPSSHVPIYLQIADGIRAAVAAGVYRAHEVVPSLRAMALELHVNPNTVQKAYDELIREGLLYSQRGRGLFVVERGTTSAQSGAEDGVRRLFDDGIRAAQAAGMNAKQIQKVFRAALDAMAHQEAMARQDAMARQCVNPQRANPPRTNQ
jgi:GntR family transcriptional regulator